MLGTVYVLGVYIVQILQWTQWKKNRVQLLCGASGPIDLWWMEEHISHLYLHNRPVSEKEQHLQYPIPQFPSTIISPSHSHWHDSLTSLFHTTARQQVSHQALLLKNRGWLRFLGEESLTLSTLALTPQSKWAEVMGRHTLYTAHAIFTSSILLHHRWLWKNPRQNSSAFTGPAPTPTLIPNEVRWPDVVYLPVTRAAMKLLHTSMLQSGGRGTFLFCVRPLKGRNGNKGSFFMKSSLERP